MEDEQDIRKMERRMDREQRKVERGMDGTIKDSYKERGMERMNLGWM
jgi:hypothetical protein